MVTQKPRLDQVDNFTLMHINWIWSVTAGFGQSSNPNDLNANFCGKKEYQ